MEPSGNDTNILFSLLLYFLISYLSWSVNILIKFQKFSRVNGLFKLISIRLKLTSKLTVSLNHLFKVKCDLFNIHKCMFHYNVPPLVSWVLFNRFLPLKKTLFRSESRLLPKTTVYVAMVLERMRRRVKPSGNCSRFFKIMAHSLSFLCLCSFKGLKQWC